MAPPVKTFWFQIHYASRQGKRAETVVYFGPDLVTVTDRISATQRGRLAYDPTGPRIVRIAVLAPPADLDRNFKTFLDECCALRVQ